MKPIFIFLMVFFFAGNLCAQKGKISSAVSDKIFITVAKESPKPPYLEIKDYSFTDTDGNNKIDAGETAIINFDLYNSGVGPGLGLKLIIKEKNSVSGLNYTESLSLPELKEGEKQHISIPLEGNLMLQSGTASFHIVINEANGFHSDPLTVEIETQAFKAPLVKLVDYQVSSQTTGILEKRKPFDLEVLVQNLGQGKAQNVSVTVQKPMNIFCLSSNEAQIIGELQPGEKRLISYQFVANAEFQSSAIDFGFTINEKYNQYAENKNLALTMNEKVSGEKLVIQGEKESDVDIQIGSLSSEVDRNIPVNTQKYPNKVALIFGNEDYSGSLNSEINVEYARRDATVFRDYVIKALGVPQENVYFFTDATLGVMKRNIDLVCNIIQKMPNQPELIFYYAGHGFPDEQNKTPYLIPVDVNATNVSSAIALKDVYQKLGETGANKITVLLDACFSGGGRNQGLMAARGVLIKPKEEILTGNMVVFSASSGEQTASPYHDQKHGMFTYYLLKKIQESNGTVTFGTLDEYLKSNIGLKSLQVNGKSQDPTTIISPSIQDTWKTLTF
jgi:hypothetical protein